MFLIWRTYMPIFRILHSFFLNPYSYIGIEFILVVIFGIIQVSLFAHDLGVISVT